MSNDAELDEFLTILERSKPDLKSSLTREAKKKLFEIDYPSLVEQAKQKMVTSQNIAHDGSFAPFSPELNWVAIDLETGGFSPKTSDIVEVGLVYYKGGNKTGEQNYLIKSNRWSYEAAKIHKIPREECDQYGVDIRDMMEYMKKVINKTHFMVAFNSDFEHRFLMHYFALTGVEPPEIEWVDPFRIAQGANIRGKGTKQNLAVLCELFEVELIDAHRAIPDARATAEVLFKMLLFLQKSIQDIMRSSGVLHISKHSQDDRPMDAIFSGLQRQY